MDGPPVMPEDPYAYVVAAFQALPPPDYVPGPEEPEQAPPSPVYIPYVPEPVYPEYIPPEDDVFPAEEQPLPTTATPTTDLPGYIYEFDSDEDLEDDDDEDPEEDPADYPADHDDDDEEEEPSGDDADEKDEDQDEDDDDEEEEHPALADSIPPPPALRVTARIFFGPQPPTLSFTKEDLERVTELAAVQEQNTQDIYGVMEDTQATLTTQISSLQRHLVTALGEIRALQAREQARAGAPEGAGSST
nr:hypothetical protein [Tanacetum cinerariifolium]